MVSRNYFGGRMAQTCAQAQTWVKDNYELYESGVVAKSVIYSNYENYCRDNGRPVMETSIFGRVVKQVFPEVQIRRLGGRDNLKYYYCGIQAQRNSPYEGDNQNTIKPKRRQRKRPNITDKAEAQNCLRWLLSNYIYDGITTLNKAELYEQYVRDTCNNWTNGLTSQDFAVVVQEGFSKVSKRRLSSKMQHQGCFIGFKRRPEPLDPSNMSTELMSENVFSAPRVPSTSLIDYREGSHTPEEDYGQRSDSEASDYQDYCKTENLRADDDLQFDEPVDYSLSSLRVKGDDDSSSMRTEKISENESISSYRSPTPEGPHSSMMESPTPSPSPPQKSTRSKIYKPRFHINYQNQMWDDPSDQDNQFSYNDSVENFDEDAALKEWLKNNLESCDGSGVHRYKIYELYKQACNRKSVECFPLVHFDKVVLKLYRGSSTTIHKEGVTLYRGIRVSYNSVLKNDVPEYNFQGNSDEPILNQWGGVFDHPMDLSSPYSEMNSESMTNFPDEEYDDPNSMDQYREQLEEEDESSMPEVLKDGKYYLKSWLQEHFEPVAEACVLKADAYKYYEMYAHSLKQAPFEMNVFGKVVRQVFPKVSIRRLGGRQKPQYHYCGIAAKSSSHLYPIMGGKDPAQRSRKKEIATDSQNTESALNWLERSFETDGKSLVMKTEVYEGYRSYCNSIGIQPHNLNYFGKLVKHMFPDIDVRKCGGRSEPNWYYHGLRYKESVMNYNQYSDSPIHPSAPLFDASHPISVPGGSTHVITSSFTNSPQIMAASGGSYLGESRFPQAYLSQSDGYGRSPDLSRPFHESIPTRGALDGSRMFVRSPDVAPEMFPRSPEGGSAAQISRSPGSSHHLGTFHDPSSGSSGSAPMMMPYPSSPRSTPLQLVPSQTPPVENFHVHDSSSLLPKKFFRTPHHLGPENSSFSNSFSGRS